MNKVWIGVIGVIAVVLLLIGAVVAVPLLFDLNDYKSQISARVKLATGRDMMIGGDIRLKILPTPRFSVGDVTFTTPGGGASTKLATIKSLDVQIALLPLLGGQVQFQHIVVGEPVIELVRLADGRRNWEIAPADEKSDGGTMAAISLDSLIIKGGTLIYRDEAAGTRQRIEQFEARISAGSMQGPFTVAATATVGGQALSATLNTGKLVAGRGLPVKLTLSLPDAGGTASYSGIVEPAGAARQLTGRIELAGNDLAALLAALAAAAQLELPSPDVLAHEFGLTADVAASDTGATFENVNFRLGDSIATGKIEALVGDRNSVSAKLAVNRIDLDKLIAGNRDDPAIDRAAGGFALPRQWDGALELDIGALSWQGGVVRQIKLSAQKAGDVIVLSRAAALLPGGSDAVLTGQAAAAGGDWQFDGSLEAASDNLRSLLSWLDIEAVERIPADRLRKFQLGAAVRLTRSVALFHNIDLRLDSLRLIGAAAYALRRRPSFTLDLQIDQLNLDAYLPRPPDSGTAPANEPASDRIGSALAQLEGFNTNTKLGIEKLTYRGVPMRDFAVDVGLYNGALTLRRLAIADLGGVAAVFEGKLDGPAAKPSVHLSGSLGGANAAGLARLADIALPLAPGILGELDVSATIDGDLDRLAVTLGGLAATTEFTIEGEVATPLTGARLNLSVQLTNQSLARVAQLTGLPVAPEMALDGPLTITAALAGRLDRNLAIDLSGDAAGTSFSVAGSIDHVLGTPMVGLTLTAHQPSLARFASQYGLPIVPVRDGDGPLVVAGTLTGGLADAKFDISFDLAGLKSKLAGNAASAENGLTYDLALSLDHRDLIGMARTFGADYLPAATGLGGFKLTARIAGDGERARVRNLEAAIGPATLRGELTVRFGGRRPHVAAKLTANDVLADRFLPAATAGVAAATGLGGGQNQRGRRWSAKPIDLSLLSALDADVEFTAAGVAARGYRFDAPELTVVLQDGVLDITRLTGKLFDGAVDLTARIRSAPVPAFDLRLELEDGELSKALMATAGIDMVSGRFDILGEFTARGPSHVEMVRSLNGTAKLAARDGAVAGIDVPAMSDELKGLADLADFPGIMTISLLGGSTRLIRGQGTWTIENGIARSSDTEIVLEAARATVSGRLDLPRWLMKVTTLLELTDHPGAPPLGIALNGPIDSPEREFRSRDLEGFLARQAAAGTLGRALDGKPAPNRPLGELRQGRTRAQ